MNFNTGYLESRLQAAQWIVSKASCKTAFEDNGVQQCWSFFKYYLLRGQAMEILKHHKSSRHGRRMVWLSRDLLELRQKKHMAAGSEVRWCGRNCRDAVCLSREKFCVAKAQLELKMDSSVVDNKKVLLKISEEQKKSKRTEKTQACHFMQTVTSQTGT